jgi:hypothetical protein
MASQRGGLSGLAIGAIFVVVFTAMWGGVQYARGDLFDHEPPTDLETQLRTAVWDAINERRAAHGLDPAQRDTATRQGARETAVQLVTIQYFAEPTAAGLRPDANRTLPNRMGFCYQTPAKLTVTEPGWPPDVDRPRSDEVTRAVADRVADLLTSIDGPDVVTQSNEQKHGLGVAVDGDVVYVVYRTCNLGY